MNDKIFGSSVYSAYVLGIKVYDHAMKFPSTTTQEILHEVARGDLTLVPSAGEMAIMDPSLNNDALAKHARATGGMIEADRDLARRILEVRQGP